MLSTVINKQEASLKMKKIIFSKKFILILFIISATILYSTHLKAENLNDKTIFKIGEIPSDIDIDLININEKSKGVIWYSKRYRSRIFKYESPKSGKIYAIKKTTVPDNKNDTILKSLEILHKEALAYQKLKDLNDIPKFYYYSGDFSNPDKTHNNNLMIVEWVKGVSISSDDISFEKNIVKDIHFEKIYNLLFEFDKRGVIHRDLWAANIIIDNDNVKIIDFDRTDFIDPTKYPEKNNVYYFEERFLNNYLSDVYYTSSKEELSSLYETTQKLKIKFLEKKADFLRQNNFEKHAMAYERKANSLKETIKDAQSITENSIKAVLDRRTTELQINLSEFDFFGKRFLNTKNILLKIAPENETIKSNLKIYELLNKVLTNNSNLNNNLDVCYEVRNLIEDSNIYPSKEKRKAYHRNVKNFVDTNINFFNSLNKKDFDEAQNILNFNKDLFHRKKFLNNYYEKLNQYLTDAKMQNEINQIFDNDNIIMP